MNKKPDMNDNLLDELTFKTAIEELAFGSSKLDRENITEIVEGWLDNDIHEFRRLIHQNMDWIIDEATKLRY